MLLCCYQEANLIVHLTQHLCRQILRTCLVGDEDHLLCGGSVDCSQYHPSVSRGAQGSHNPTPKFLEQIKWMGHLSPTPESNPDQSCHNVSILLMVCVLADALHGPQICNHLIAIAILLYYHYTKSSGECSEHVISAKRENLLDFTKCHRFPKKWIRITWLCTSCSDVLIREWRGSFFSWSELFSAKLALWQLWECPSYRSPPQHRC